MVFFCIPGPARDHADRGGLRQGAPTDERPRKLWTGPHGSAGRDRAIERASAEASSLWLVPSAIAREQVIRALAPGRGAERPGSGAGTTPGRRRPGPTPDPPARLSPAGRIAALCRGDRAGPPGRPPRRDRRAVEWPGYRRQLLDRFAAWTPRSGPVGRPAPTESPVDREEWAVFGHYRATLEQVGAEDPEGFAAWASRALIRTPPPELAKAGHVVAIDPIAPEPGRLAAPGSLPRPGPVDDRLPALRPRARAWPSCMPGSSRPAAGSRWGFVEEADRADGFSFRPPGLDFIERELFRCRRLHPTTAQPGRV